MAPPVAPQTHDPLRRALRSGALCADTVENEVNRNRIMGFNEPRILLI